MANYYLNHYHMENMSLETGYDSSSDTSSTAPWESFSEDVLPRYSYAHSMSPTSAASTGAPNTPAMHAARPSTSRSSSSTSVKKITATYPTSAPETEEERRRNRKREQNRESQRAFRRRQENRVKFLETKTLELETSTRQLRAENEQLRVALLDSRNRNNELVNSMMSITPSPLNLAQDIVPSIESDRQYYGQGQELDPRVVW